VTTASQPSWTGAFTGLSPRCFGRLVTALPGRLTPLFGISESAADRIIARLHNLTLAG